MSKLVRIEERDLVTCLQIAHERVDESERAAREGHGAFYGQTSMALHYRGVKGEWAVGGLIGLPVRRGQPFDNGIDFEPDVPGRGPTTLDVKTIQENGRKLPLPPHQEEILRERIAGGQRHAEFYVVAREVGEHRVAVLGMISVARFLQRAGKIDLGHGPCIGIEIDSTNIRVGASAFVRWVQTGELP